MLRRRAAAALAPKPHRPAVVLVAALVVVLLVGVRIPVPAPSSSSSSPSAPGPRPRYESLAAAAPAKLRRRRRRRRKTSSGDHANSTTSIASSPRPAWAENLDGAVLLVVCHDRADYLARSLASVLEHYPFEEGLGLPVLISEDGRHDEVRAVVEEFRAGWLEQQQWQQQQQQQWHGEGTNGSTSRPAAVSVPVQHVHHRQPLLRLPEEERDGYHRLTRHHRWALSQAFAGGQSLFGLGRPVDKVIVLEEDLAVAPDFFAYFGRLAPLLDAPGESNLMAVSAWNDNGMHDRVRRDGAGAGAVYRSEFFGGLGWMLTRALWAELEPKWPRAYWDDWLREPGQRRGRHFLRPEVSRTLHFGARGTSNGQFSALLDQMVLNNDSTALERALDVPLLGDPAAYDRAWRRRLHTARDVSWPTLLQADGGPGGGEGEGEEVRVVYRSLEVEFAFLARRFGLFADVKSGVPKTGHKGVVSFYYPPVNATVHLVPDDWRERFPEQ